MNHHGSKRYMKKFPRCHINTYPEGVLHESMKAAYKQYICKVEYWERRDFLNYCNKSHAIIRWLRKGEKHGFNRAYSKFLKICNWEFKDYFFNYIVRNIIPSDNIHI